MPPPDPLSAAQLKKVRAAVDVLQRAAPGGIIKRALAVEYAVSVGTIKLLLSGKTYPPSADTIDSSLSRPA